MVLQIILCNGLDLIVIWSFYKLVKKASAQMQELVTRNLRAASIDLARHEATEAQRREDAWRELDYQQIRLIESMMTLMEEKETKEHA